MRIRTISIVVVLVLAISTVLIYLIQSERTSPTINVSLTVNPVCDRCIQGSQPSIPNNVISVDGVISGNGSFQMLSNTKHTFSALLSYTGTCVGVPCNGQGLTVHFQFWQACYYDLPAASTESCSDYSLANANNANITITIPAHDLFVLQAIYYGSY